MLNDRKAGGYALGLRHALCRWNAWNTPNASRFGLERKCPRYEDIDGRDARGGPLRRLR
jgi:hypothetical protein